MRSISWVASGAVVAALAGLVLPGGPSGASAQMAVGSPQMAMGYGYPARGYYYGYPARPYYYRPVKPAPRVKRFYRAVPPGTCGQFHYWSKGRCLNARTSPPKLK